MLDVSSQVHLLSTEISECQTMNKTYIVPSEFSMTRFEPESFGPASDRSAPELQPLPINQICLTIGQIRTFISRWLPRSIHGWPSVVAKRIHLAWRLPDLRLKYGVVFFQCGY